MGRNIPSFRKLIEIDLLNLLRFKKGLTTKNDKEAFDSIFENTILYMSRVFIGEIANGTT